MESVLRKKKEFIGQIQRSAAKGDKNPDWVTFVSTFLESAPIQYLHDQTEKKILNQLYRSWTFFSKKQPHPLSFQYQIDPKRKKLCVEVYQKDTPFIVETLKNAMSSFNIQSDFVFHPVYRTKRTEEGNLLNIYPNKNTSEPHYGYESLLSFEANWNKSTKEADTFIQDLIWRLSLIQLCVDDWPRMRKTIQMSMPKKQQPEASYFDWLYQDNFLFLGMRTLNAQKSNKILNFPLYENSLGIFKDKTIAQDKNFFFSGWQSSKTTLNFHTIKTHYRSPINRPARVDMIELFDEKNKCIHQIIGIFTRRSYTASNFKIPVIKTKAERIFNAFELKHNWHDGKMLEKALESIPHDEYWHFSEESIQTLCSQLISFHVTSLPTYISTLSEDKTSITMIVFMGRERYSTNIRQELGNALCDHLNGIITSTRSIIDDSPFARIIYVFNHVKNSWRENDFVLKILKEISLSWNEKRHQLLLQHHKKDSYFNTFGNDYQNDFTPEQAHQDISLLEQIKKSQSYGIKCFFSKDALEHTFETHFNIRITSLKKPIVLSNLMNILKNFGITVQQEQTYVLNETATNESAYLHACLGSTVFEEKNKTSHNVSKTTLKCLEKTIIKTLCDDHPNDHFNQLILSAHMSERDIHVFRTFGEYMQQIRYPYTLDFIADSLSEFPKIATYLLTLFKSRFDPKKNDKTHAGSQKKSYSKLSPGGTSLKKITSNENESEKSVEAQYDSSPIDFEKRFQTLLKPVTSSQQDQLFRDLQGLIKATLRTNYFQKKPYLSLKFDCALIQELPDPKPYYEVFVSSYVMQGIHLRSSKIARGGIRYSDRPQDFRSEILQLMQAQNLKNAIIVPSGAKGGFIIKKRNPSNNDVISSYKTLISGLLDITDNWLDGQKWQNPDVRSYDDFDPYLVVAADKGTASFSDIANELSKNYNFWLDDAFASGGSHGYDHKQLGITAKGAFVSIRHHFKKLNIDLEKDIIHVIGIGDMSGDVFGNGMLIHKKCHLVAAFNHKHIFIDPNPITEKAYHARRQLFEASQKKSGLSWSDYNKNALSKGGAIYNRSDKILKLSKEIQRLFGLPESVTPNQCIKALLHHSCDLLWFGGIGTYIKGSEEIYLGDSSNDAIRVNARDIQAKVIGEGANLGVTPLARIEMGLKGIYINSDAIDNAGGVNCSDREVNLKILMGDIPNKERDLLLHDISLDIVNLILNDNSDQNHALDVLEEHASSHHHDYCDLLNKLEGELYFKRQTVFLDKDTILRKQRSFLTRSELAILLSYGKIYLKQQMLSHFDAFKDGADFALEHYFPKRIRQEFSKILQNHLLYKELASLVLSNRMINTFGILWLMDLNIGNATHVIKKILAQEEASYESS